MTTARVMAANEISLNGVYYPLTKPIQPMLSSQYPSKLVLGDTTRDSNPNASALALSDWRGGIGMYQVGELGPVDRAWWSTCQLRYANNLVLPGLATITAASGVSGTFTVGAIGELANEVYAAFGTSIRKYNNVTDSWGNELAALPAVATAAITFRINNVTYLAFATSGGYTYTSDGVSWTDQTKDTLYMTFWNNGLWGIDSTGQLWSSFSIGNESNESQLPLPNDYVTALFVARDAAGDPIIYAATKVGLFANDYSNQKFEETELKLPFHPNGGLGTTKWRDSTFMPAGLGVYQYINGVNSAVITIMGPDRDFGLPSDKRGTIKQLLASHNDLLAILDSTTAPGTTLNMFDGSAMGSHQAAVIQVDTGYSAILGWDGKGWECKWLSGSAAKAITAALVSNAYSTYRIWWGHNQRVYYMDLPSDIINPNELTTFKYAASAEHITPWFNMGQIEVDKLSLRLNVDASDMSANETLVVDYALNLSDAAWTNLGTITSNGITTYEFPNSTAPAGTVFRWIRFRLTLARGSTNTLTPQVHVLVEEWRKKLSVKWAFIATIDMTKGYKGNSPMQLQSSLLTAISSTTLVEYTHRNDDGGTRNYYVDVIPLEGFEYTGVDERGQAMVRLEER